MLWDHPSPWYGVIPNLAPLLCPQELSLLPLTEPTITANFSLFAPFGSSPINGKSQLRGAFGSAVLDSVPDYYSQLLTKVRGLFLHLPPQSGGGGGVLGHNNPLTPPPVLPLPTQNNLSNPPTPPSSLPPTPPPSVQQKMVNGVTAAEEMGEQPKDADSTREPQKGEYGRCRVAQPHNATCPPSSYPFHPIPFILSLRRHAGCGGEEPGPAGSSAHPPAQPDRGCQVSPPSRGCHQPLLWVVLVWP